MGYQGGVCGDDTCAGAEAVFRLTISENKLSLYHSASNVTKIYDGTMDHTGSVNAAQESQIGYDKVEFYGYTVTFNDPDAGTKQVMITGKGLTGKDAGNCKLAGDGIIRFNGVINPRSVAINKCRYVLTSNKVEGGL